MSFKEYSKHCGVFLEYADKTLYFERHEARALYRNLGEIYKGGQAMTEPIWKDQFKEAKVGDRVWHIIYGWGTIITIEHRWLAPIEFRYDYEGNIDRVNFDGKYEDIELFPSVFWGPIELKEIPQRPKRFVKKKIEGWANIYERRPVSLIVYPFPQDAQKGAMHGRLGNKSYWVSFEIEVEE